jgi:hypothetical protein
MVLTHGPFQSTQVFTRPEGVGRLTVIVVVLRQGLYAFRRDHCVGSKLHDSTAYTECVGASFRSYLLTCLLEQMSCFETVARDTHHQFLLVHHSAQKACHPA